MQLTDVGRTNRVHSDEEIKAILQSISDTEHVLRNLDGDIAELTRSKHALLKERRKITGQLKRYQIALAPHRKLPEDVVRYIITICAQDPQVVTIPFSRKDTPPQLVLSHVCSAWRYCALTTPLLWNNIEIKTVPLTFCVVRIAQEWLSRATNHPISLKFIFHFCSTGSEALANSVIRDMILPHQFKKLDIRFYYSGFQQIDNLHKDPTFDLCRLLYSLSYAEEIRLNGHVTMGHDRTSSFPLVGDGKFPHLKLLELNLGRWFSSYDFGIPWHQLLHLNMSISPVSAAWCLSILRQCVSLDRCRLFVTTEDTPEFTPPTKVIVLPNLRKLGLRLNFMFEHANAFLRALVLPGLKSLAIDPGLCPFTWPSTTDSKIAERFNLQQLQELRVVGETASPFLLGSLLESAPSLRLIELPPTTAYDRDTLIGLSTGHLGPCLQSLISPTPDQAFAVVQMVRLRHKHANEASNNRGEDRQVVPFKDVKLQCWMEEYECHLNALKALGVNVDVHNGFPF
ncbi:hypothetical protein AX17_005250 [Amanita inopinata Kibby_2008]|nr:hypothetical protein AX17_005250 [Amanita inopinata Kibby_2008]